MRKRLQHTPVPPPEHQGSRRVGPPVKIGRGVRGFLIPPLIFWIAFAGTIAEFGAMIYSMSCMDCTFRGSGDGGRF